MNTQIQSALEWRYATKGFDPSKKVSQEDLDTLLDAVRLSPSSLGLQPWKILVISDTQVREKLKAAAWNQAQVTDASQVIVFAARKNLSESYVDSYLKIVAETRGQEVEDTQGYRQMIMGSVMGRSDESLFQWNARQVYIALGILLETAALMKIDACPMEGFDAKQFDTILGLDETDYTSIVIAPVGYRSSEDKYSSVPKVRFSKEQIMKFV